MDKLIISLLALFISISYAPGAFAQEKPSAFNKDRPGAFMLEKPGAFIQEEPGAFIQEKPGAFIQEEPGTVPNFSKRDPFIPLVDDNGAFRTNFNKPIDSVMFLSVTVQGISKIGGVFYVNINGEWLKEGDKTKGMVIERIELDKVTLNFEGKKMTVGLSQASKP
jgi:hypothetical protein